MRKTLFGVFALLLTMPFAQAERLKDIANIQGVRTNQLIGYSGNTGNTTGPHLHLERRPRYGGYGSDKNPNLWP